MIIESTCPLCRRPVSASLPATASEGVAQRLVAHLHCKACTVVLSARSAAAKAVQHTINSGLFDCIDVPGRLSHLSHADSHQGILADSMNGHATRQSRRTEQGAKQLGNSGEL